MDSVNRQRGFSLIELLIVVAIFLIIAGIAIPRFMRARIAANEASTAGSMKQIGIANAAYASLYNQGYAGSLAQLGPPGGACASVSSACADLLDSLMSGVSPSTPTPTKSGYQYTYYAEFPDPTIATPNNTYGAVANPSGPSTGVSTFCFDNRLSIYRDTTGGLTSADFNGCTGPWEVRGGGVGPL